MQRQGRTRRRSWKALGAILAAGLLAGSAGAAVLYVAPAGNDAGNLCTNASSPCASVGRAFAVASSGDEIRVAVGNYAEPTVAVAGPLTGVTVSGGWATDFSSQQSDPTLTVLSGSNLHRLFRFDANATTLDITLQNLTLRDGEAETGSGPWDDRRGGAIWLWATQGGAATVRLQGVEVLSNRAEFGGGALFAVADNSGTLELDLTQVRVQGSQAWGANFGGEGGGVFVIAQAGSSATIWAQDSRFEGNLATAGGGGILFSAEGGTVGATFARNRFRQNSASIQGGGAMLRIRQGGILNFSSENDLFDANTAGAPGGGGGLFLNLQGDGTISSSLTNDTLTDNSPDGIGEVRDTGAGTATLDLLNTILWGNASEDLSGDPALSASASYSDVGTVVGSLLYSSDSTDFAADPLFSDPATGDYHLGSASSPAVDAGLCGEFVGSTYVRRAPLDDFEGDLRPGTNQVTGCDVGVDERVPEPSGLALGLAAGGALALLARRRAR